MSTSELLGSELLRLGIVFHWPSWEQISVGFDPERYIRILKQIGIQTVTVEAKDELGWSYFPTEVGIPHPNLKGDYFGERYSLLKENGFRVIAYYNVGVQGRLFDAHPDWLAQHDTPDAVSPPGPDGHRHVSFFCPYVEEHLLPHLREFVDRYDSDELWLDIFSPWLTALTDFNPHSRERFREEMGRDLLPVEEDPDPVATRRYFRDHALRIRKQLCDTVRSIRPNLVVAINVAYRWPECRYQDDVTWLSWDVHAPGCRLAAMPQLGWLGRLYASYPLPSDIVLPTVWWWGSNDLKPADVFSREAASLLAIGTAVYAYDTAQPPGGSFDEARLAPFIELADFVRPRQDVFLRGERLAEILLLTSAAASTEGRLHNPAASPGDAPPAHHDWELKPRTNWTANQRAATYGATHLLQPHGYVFRFTGEDYLENHLATCRLLVLPQQIALDEDTADIVRAYVDGGGRLLIVGPVPLCLQSWLGISGDPLAPPGPAGYLQTVGGEPTCPVALRAPWHKLECPDGTVALRSFHPRQLEEMPDDVPQYVFFARRAQQAEAAGWLLTAGCGRVLVCSADIFGAYWETPSLGILTIWQSILKSLEFEPFVRVQAQHPVEVVTAHDKDSLLVHLVNQSESQDRLFYPLRVPPAGAMHLEVQTSTQPRTVVRWPEGRELKPKMKGGRVTVDLADLDIHACVEFSGIAVPVTG